MRRAWDIRINMRRGALRRGRLASGREDAAETCGQRVRVKARMRQVVADGVADAADDGAAEHRGILVRVEVVVRLRVADLLCHGTGKAALELMPHAIHPGAQPN